MSEFEVQGCSSVTERCEKALVDAIANGVDQLSAEQTDGICNFICRKDVLAALPTVSLSNQCCSQLISWHELN